MRRFVEPGRSWLVYLIVMAIAVTLDGSTARLRAEAPATPDVVRFLEQATWVPPPTLIEHVRSVGFDAYLDEQFAAPASSYPALPLYPTTRDTTTCPNGSTCVRDNYTMYPLQARFFTN